MCIYERLYKNQFYLNSTLLVAIRECTVKVHQITAAGSESAATATLHRSIKSAISEREY